EAVTARLADAAELVGAHAPKLAVEPRAFLAPVGHDGGRTACEGCAAREQRDERRQQEGTAAHGRLSHAPALDIGPLSSDSDAHRCSERFGRPAYTSTSSRRSSARFTRD